MQMIKTSTQGGSVGSSQLWFKLNLVRVQTELGHEKSRSKNARLTLKVVYTKKTMIAMVYMGIMTPSVPPVLFCVGCIPGPPMVGLMPGIGPPCNNDSHGYLLSYSGPHYPPLPFLVNSPHRQGRSSSPRWSSLLHVRVEEPTARIRRVSNHSWGENDLLLPTILSSIPTLIICSGRCWCVSQ